MATVLQTTDRPTISLDRLRALLAGVAPVRIPSSTYRLQFHAGFTFNDARDLVPYLAQLGISDVYASPYLKARTGSAHGYDVANPNSLNPEVGSEDDYRAFVTDLTAYDMGQVLDMVPNHMGIGDPGNGWWQDVLENGPASVYADFFDIDWSTPADYLLGEDKVLLPILGDQYGRVLEAGELTLRYEHDGLAIGYHSFRLPVALESYVPILARVRDRLADRAATAELGGLLDSLADLPPRRSMNDGARQERHRLKEAIKGRLAAACQHHAGVRHALEAVLNDCNGRPDDPHTFDTLDELLDAQSYRLAFWRVAAEEINYRRFFDVNDLAAIRVEDSHVFRATHALLLVLVRLGAVSGVRIDHPDGLLDPAGHLMRLQRNCFIERHADALAAQLDGGIERADVEAALQVVLSQEPPAALRDLLVSRGMYVTVEKILSPTEQLRAEWPVHGTTGYDFLNALNGLFVARENRHTMDAAYSSFVGLKRRFADVANSTRKMVMLIALPGEVNGLAARLKRLAGRDRRHRDFTRNALAFAVRELLACLPVYRTYIDPSSGAIHPADRAAIDVALAEVIARNPRTDPSVFTFVAAQLQTAVPDPETEAERQQLVARFQQLSGAVMAKGVEDTAFYQYHRLISLNEVGADPDTFGVSIRDFHRTNQRRRQAWPASMLASSTHDTKRSEDVRARINVLSERPRRWRAATVRWSRANAAHKTMVDGKAAPDRQDEYLLYQTLIGVWPDQPFAAAEGEQLADRVVAAMRKAAREAKMNTSWINVNMAYEEALERFIRLMLDGATGDGFLRDFGAFAATVANLGMFNSLSQTVVKLASPGVPDIYQGCDLWDFSLVDPDNRRPVDYARRRNLLEELETRAATSGQLALARDLLTARSDGAIKLYLTRHCLRLRQRSPAIFAGDYLPLQVRGPRRAHIIAFARGGPAGQVAVTVAPRLMAGLLGDQDAPVGVSVWAATELQLPLNLGTRFRNILTGEVLASDSGTLEVGRVLGEFPVALLVAA